MKYLTFILFTFVSLSSAAQHYDWPMWRFDHNRSASTPEKLADKLYLQWQIQYTARNPVWDDPLNQNLMQYDRLYEPIVAGNKMFIGFNDQDKVIALDLNSGKELWHFFADGPVRMPLAANNGKIYFTGDDGYCYCLNAESGDMLWKKRLAPAGEKLLGNKRLISMWPARGGIVIKDNIIYTAASIFPMMGTFIYALDAETGDVIWKNESTGSNYILQPHRSPAFADIAPQGSFTISGDKLLVAGGRTVPAAFDLKTGEEKYFHLAASGKTGGSFICSNDAVYFNHYRERMTYMFDTKTGEILKEKAGEYPVVDGNIIYFSGKKITASILKDTLQTLWQSDFCASNDLIKAGDCLFAADSIGISAIRIEDNAPLKLWTLPTEKPAERLLASNGKLIAVTADGLIMVFGDTPVKQVSLLKARELPIKARSSVADEIIKSTGIIDGYAAIYGTKDIKLLKALVLKTSLRLVAIDKDPSRIEYLRKYFNYAGISADRLSFLTYEQAHNSLPKYFSSLTVITDPYLTSGFDKIDLEALYESTRPYGGKIWIKTNHDECLAAKSAFNELNAYGISIAEGKGYTMITRSGSLKGSDNWTHNYGDIANTIKSDDDLVKAPLGILWFGGNSNTDVLPRHGHGPPEQVIDGRLIIQGINTITTRDVYTGRLLWQKKFEKLKDDSWLVYYDESYDGDSPLDTKYNQEHLPGANARGTNFIATKEFVYVIEGNKCHLLDINTGKVTKVFTTGDAKAEKIGYIGVYKDLLILGNNFTNYPELPFAEGEEANSDEESKKFENFNVTASRELVILNRFTGEKKWSIVANHGFIHNSVIAGDSLLFCLDKLPQYLETKLRRRGQEIPEGSRLLYLDINTGEKLYEETRDIFGTWLGYSSDYKLLLQATRPSRDMLNGEEGQRMIVYKTVDHQVLWDKNIEYSNPPIISNDKIFTEGEGFLLLSGDPILKKDPVTGEDIKWSYKREYGCGYVIASEHLLTFRSASAGFINLDVFEGTGNLGGFKAGCSANLIVANGVLNSPDYTRTCQCPYQNQTSLAFINMPWMNYWTNSNYKWNGKQVRSLGINLNAPGDRVSSEDILWFEYPNVGGEATGIDIKIDSVDYLKIRKDPVSVKSESTPWICASALRGIRRMEITLSRENLVPDAAYNVRLYFSELENSQPGERVFNIKIQDSEVLDNFDIIREAGQPDKEVIKSFSGIRAGEKIIIELSPVKGNTILSGVELIREDE